MHFQAQLADGHFLVLWLRPCQQRQHFAHGGIGFDVFFKAGNGGHQMLEFGHVFGRGEQKQNRIQVGFFRNHRALAQVVRQDGGGDAEFIVAAGLQIDAGRGEQQFARVNHILIGTVAVKIVPLRLNLAAGGKLKKADVVGHIFAVVVLPGQAVDFGRHKRADQLTGLQQHFARFDAAEHALAPHAPPGLAFVHFGVDIERGKQRVKRAGRHMHHKGVVKALVVAIACLLIDVVVFFVDLRGLRKAGLLLVHRLGY